MKKNWLARRFWFLFIITALLLSTFAIAGIGDAVSDVLDIGRLSFLGSNADNQLVGFIRILLGILVFSILYWGLRVIPGITQPIAVTIGIILAIITAVFFPGSVLLVFGETYATIFAVLLIFGPMAGLFALCFFTPTPNRATAALKLLGILFIWWVVSKLNTWAEILGRTIGS